ncbi:MAG: rod shape-determining protein MreD [Acidobacteria bacterium]|nr:MAG: rod shape-determining protein MreD [Acidobacteriota bacterium]
MNRLLRGMGVVALAIGGHALTVYVPVIAGFFDFFLIIVVYYAVTTEQVNAILVGAVCGLVQDALFSPIIGVNAFAKALLGYLIGGLSSRMLLHQVPAQLLILGAATVLQTLVLFGLQLVLGFSADLPGSRQLFRGTLGNVVLGGLLYAALRRRRGSMR